MPPPVLKGALSSPDAAATPWAQARDVLKKAEMYSLTTVRSDGRPHVAPLIAIWLDDALHFATGPGQQNAKNLMQGPHCAITTGSNSMSEGLDLVVEGIAAPVNEESTLRRLADLYKAKYDWDYAVRDGALYFFGFHDQLDIPHGGVETLVFAVTPEKVFGFGRGDAFSQTRWRF